MTSAARVRAYRQRQKEGIELPLCSCGKRLNAERTRAQGLCSRCWKKTPEAKAETLARVKKLRQISRLHIDET